MLLPRSILSSLKMLPTSYKLLQHHQHHLLIRKYIPSVVISIDYLFCFYFISNSSTDESKNVVSELDPALPGFGSAVEEHHNALSICLVLMLLGICILLIHIMLKFNFHYVPESVVIIFIG